MAKYLTTLLKTAACAATVIGLTASLIQADYPSDVIDFFDDWKITLGDGNTVKSLVGYRHSDYFYTANDGEDWVVYKTPNSGGTTPNSSNTRSELRHYTEWTPEVGAKLTGTLKVMHVSTSGDARVPACFSVVVGQIHSDEGHENEPLKIFYKKFPGHSKGSVFWHYEINPEGSSNSGRWDYSTAVWGNDWSVVGETADSYPDEPIDGIELEQVFSYEVNVYQGIMYLTFTAEGMETKTFTKSLIESEYTAYADIPQQVLTTFASTGQDGTERATAYADEIQYFKQGAYNQTNGKDPNDNMVWNTGSDTYEGSLQEQYEHGSYAEVWFKEAGAGPATAPSTSNLREELKPRLELYPNPCQSNLKLMADDAIQSVTICSLSGKTIQSIDANACELELDISLLSEGLYIVNVWLSNGNVISTRFVKG